MGEIYNSLSIKDAPDRYFEEGVLDGVVLTKFIEAEVYRKSFLATTLTRLRWAELVNNDTDSDLSIFWEKMPRQVFMHVIMLDFYYGVPTTVDCVLSKLGTRTGARIIAESIDEKLVCKRDSDRDHRVKWLQPSIKMVQAYEQRAAKWIVTRIAVEERLDRSPIIKELLRYDQLRKKYLPANVYENVSFNLDDLLGDEETDIHNPLIESNKGSVVHLVS